MILVSISRILGYNKKRNSELSELEKYISDCIKKINECKSVDAMLLEEARCRQRYYQGFNTILKNHDMTFNKRTKRPPMDGINALISFGNTILYNRVQQIIWKSGLDSRIGIIHAANRRHYSLNLDFADLFKPIIVDRVIFSLVNRMQIGKDSFTINKDDSVYLNDEGKRTFLKVFSEKMWDKITVNCKKMSYHQLIEREILAYKKHLMEGVKYRPYKYY